MQSELEHGVGPFTPRRKSTPRTLLCYTQGVAWNILLAVVPTFLRPNSTNSHAKSYKGERQLRPTAYMDGLRGLVALLVFVRHFSLPWQKNLDYGYGYNGDYSIMKLPFPHILFSGPLVPIFFIISGYVLSATSLTLSQTSKWEPLVLRLASSAFRRGIRLYLPPTISTFGVMLLAHAGYFSFPYQEMAGKQPPTHAPKLDKLDEQLTDWLHFVLNDFLNPWRWDMPLLHYGPHLWTIPVSFRGSMVVFLACLIVVRVKSNVRLVLLGAGITYAFACGRWEVAPFLAGMMLCEMDLRRAGGLPRFRTVNRPSLPYYIWRFFWLSCFLVGLYISSFPRYNHGGICATGYQAMCRITTIYYYWHAVGAFAIMIAVARLDTLQRPLNLAVTQYLGTISFAMYIIHEPLLHVFGFFTVPFFWSLLGNETTWTYQAGFLLGMSVNGMVLIWLADLFHRHVENPCGRFSAWVERKCFTPLCSAPGADSGTALRE